MKLVTVDETSGLHLGRETAEAYVAAAFLKGRGHLYDVGRDYIEAARVPRKGLRNRKSGIIGILDVRTLEKLVEDYEEPFPLTDFLGYSLDPQHLCVEVAVPIGVKRIAVAGTGKPICAR